MSSKVVRNAWSILSMSVSAPRAARLVTSTSVQAARHDAGKMLKLGIDVQAHAMQADPAAHPHADRGDLRAVDKNADLAGVTLAFDAEPRQRGDQPVFERGDERPHVAAACRQVEHDVGHALAWAVIGEAAAASGLEHRKSIGREQLARIGAGAGGVDRGMLQQPHAFGSLLEGDGGGPRLHHGYGFLIGHEARAGLPFHVLRGWGGRFELCRGHGHQAWL